MTQLDCYHWSDQPYHICLPFGDGADVCLECYQHVTLNVFLAINRTYLRSLREKPGKEPSVTNP